MRTDLACESGHGNGYLSLWLSQPSRGVVLDSAGFVTVVNDDNCIS